ncbi:hypothetical protein K470DRAFT_266493 [Piedraia hortae CBS 480.64]|uniref:DUF7082 domain-containing protein n=1 Tax=Piedraia hortae CBS 480.64 TaxID=1314780 RepID=A0A6A7BS54_9PEZI|nr:hypothetical protein K470DRAFT_266493 [Piedraia hortae CBS 480.64]
MLPRFEITNNTLDQVPASWLPNEIETQRRLVVFERRRHLDTIYTRTLPCSETSTSSSWLSDNMYAISCLWLGENYFFISLYNVTCLLGFLQHGNPHVFSMSGIWQFLKAAEPMPGRDSRFNNWFLSDLALRLQKNRCLPNSHVPMGYDFIPWGDLQVYLEKGFNAFGKLEKCVRRVDPGDQSFRGAWVPSMEHSADNQQDHSSGGLTSLPHIQAQHGEGAGGTNDPAGNNQQQLPCPSLGGISIPPWSGPSHRHEEDSYSRVNTASTDQQKIRDPLSFVSCDFDNHTTADGHGPKAAKEQEPQATKNTNTGNDDVNGSMNG